MAHGLSIAFCPVSRKKVRFSLCDSHTLRLAREHAPMLLIFPPRHSIILPLSVCAGVSEWQTMRTQNPLVATPCGFKSHHRHHVGMDYAPFKKPSRLAGLFSYRSVIPPSPHKTLLRKFLRGPRRPAGWQTQAVYRLRRLFFAKSSRAHSAAPSRPKSRRICGGWPRNAPAGAVASPENPAARVFPGTPPPCRAATHCAPFKKPSRLTGLFSYRSVIPPSPHKTLLHKLSRGPAALCSIQSARPFGRAFLVPPAQNHQIQKPLPLCLSTFLRQAPIFARRAGENFGIIHNYEPMFLYGMMIPVTSNRKGI